MRLYDPLGLVPLLRDELPIGDGDDEIKVMGCQGSIDDSDVAIENAMRHKIGAGDTEIERGGWVRDEQVLQVERLVDVVVVRAGEACGER